MPFAARIRELGTVEYADTYRRMREFTDARDHSTADEIWLLEHPGVYTLGTNADEDHVIDAGDTAIVRTDRGGQVTWHGPGQLVVYVLLDLKRSGLGIRELVCLLEQAIIELLEQYGIAAGGREGAPGVYCDGAKIASVGLRIRRNRSYHGIAINVSNELAPFAGINPCGYEGLDVTRVCDQGGPADIGRVATDLLPLLLRRLALEPLEAD
ncbi:MAG: lipoyl(octanoyl) transferase LipB [Gammaproteobacteria bacterium]|jgi:lipoyl(octanoyl) transferase